METEKRVSKTSLLFEARHHMRNLIALETLLLEQTALLPEDRYGAEPRECFQLGAAQAFLDAGSQSPFAPEMVDLDTNPLEMLDEEMLEQIIHAFCTTRPFNKYSGEHYFDPCELEAFVRAYSLVRQAACVAAPDIAI